MCCASQLTQPSTIGPVDKQTVIKVIVSKFPNCRPDAVGHWLTSCPGVKASGMLSRATITNRMGNTIDKPEANPIDKARIGSRRNIANDCVVFSLLTHGIAMNPHPTNGTVKNRHTTCNVS